MSWGTIEEENLRPDNQSGSAEILPARAADIRAYAQAALNGIMPARPYMIIAPAPEFLAAALELRPATEIRLSAQTIMAHKHHNETTAEIYATLPILLLERGLWVKRPKDGRISAYAATDGKIWEMGIKRTKKAEIYIPTLHLCEARRYKIAAREGIILNT